MLQVLNVNFNDVIGGQFNNFECREHFKAHNVKHKFFVLDKLSNDDCVILAWSRFARLRRCVNGMVHRLEKYLSIQSLLYPTPLQLIIRRHFHRADVVHYHIVHNGWFSILAMPWLARLKPTVWTIHDPWLLTGHCIYPLDCGRWQMGCGSCPYLNLTIAMRKDRSAFMFRLKKWLLGNSPVKFVVASQWMKRMLELSPIGKHLDVAVIPFGVDLEMFKPTDNAEIRRSLGIPQENMVLFCRSNQSPYKGVSYIRDALNVLIQTSSKPITLLTVEAQGLFDDFVGKCQIIENPWEHNVERLSGFYRACDIFLMPSTAEAFGLMAIEAMASGKPVVFFKGTSLDEVTFAPRAGVGAKMQDSVDLARVIGELINDDSRRMQMGREARKIAEEHYNVKHYLRNMSDLYKDLHYKNVARA